MFKRKEKESRTRRRVSMSQSVCRQSSGSCGQSKGFWDSGRQHHIQGCKYITGKNHCTTGIASCHINPKLKNKTSNMTFLFFINHEGQKVRHKLRVTNAHIVYCDISGYDTKCN